MELVVVVSIGNAIPNTILEVYSTTGPARGNRRSGLRTPPSHRFSAGADSSITIENRRPKTLPLALSHHIRPTSVRVVSLRPWPSSRYNSVDHLDRSGVERITANVVSRLCASSGIIQSHRIT